MAKQTSAKWPRKRDALSRSQPASQAIKYCEWTVSGCAADLCARLPCCRFCSCPASAKKNTQALTAQMHRKEVISLAQFLFKLAFSISFHKTIEAVASVPAHRLRLQSAVLTRVVAVWYPEVSWLSVPFCYLPYMPYALCFIYYQILCFHYAESWDLTWILHTTKTLLLPCSSLYWSWCNHLSV